MQTGGQSQDQRILRQDTSDKRKIDLFVATVVPLFRGAKHMGVGPLAFGIDEAGDVQTALKWNIFTPMNVARQMKIEFIRNR